MQEDHVSAKEMGKLEKLVLLDCQSVWRWLGWEMRLKMAFGFHSANIT